MTAMLLSTKFGRPAIPARTVDRPSLYALLSEPRSLVVVSGPAGYGKTTLVAAWLAAEERRVAWLTLDTSDNDQRSFLAYLVAAVRRSLPALDEGLEAAVAGQAAAGTAALIPLLNALDAVGEPLVIVMDDYQRIVEPAIHDLVSFLVSHAPDAVRVVVATRVDPALPLARLRARGKLTEIRASNLRFSALDTHRFLRDSMGVDISEETAERLTDRTEGWIAGVQLAGLSLRGSADPDAFVEAFGTSDRYIFDYLTDEALARQPPEVRSFLEATSILERLTGPLCDALTGGADGSATLERLADANLFLLPLDDRRAWYRYHPLFADLLSAALPDERRVALHRAAAAWLAGHGHPSDAIAHRLAAGDAAEAAALMEDAAEETLARGEFGTIIGWCRDLPAGVLADHQHLAVLRAWALFLSGDIAGAEAGVPELGAPGRGTDPRSDARRACLLAWFANRRDRPEAEELARTAVAGIPETDPVFRSLAFTTLGEARIGHDAREAAAAFEEARRYARVSERSTLAVATVYSLANASLVLGRRSEAEELCRRSLAELGRGGASPPSAGVLHLPLGVAYFDADRLDLARQHIAIGLELADRAGLRVTMLGAAEWTEILTLHLLGETAQAWQRLEAVRREGRRHGLARLVSAMRLLGAELLLLEGDPASAAARLEGEPLLLGDALGTVRDRGRATAARIQLALGRPREALEILDALAGDQRAGGRMGRLVSTLTLTAVARERTGHRPATLAALAEAARLAGPEDIRFPFLDRVFPVEQLLPAVRHVAPAFVDDVVRRLGGVGGRAPAQVVADGPFEPLSVRELEVLRLVTAGLSNDEIGRELYVTGGTAKWHVHNVLAKLGCRNRVALVARARSLRLV